MVVFSAYSLAMAMRSSGPGDDGDEPGEHGGDRRADQDPAAGAVGVLDLVAVARIPGEVPDAVQRVEPGCGRQGEQAKQPEPGGHEPLHLREGGGPCRG